MNKFQIGDVVKHIYVTTYIGLVYYINHDILYIITETEFTEINTSLDLQEHFTLINEHHAKEKRIPR